MCACPPLEVEVLFRRAHAYDSAGRESRASRADEMEQKSSDLNESSAGISKQLTVLQQLVGKLVAVSRFSV